MKIAFFDFESTDKDPLTAGITEACVQTYDVSTKRVLSTYSEIISDVGADLTPRAVEITGLTDELLKTNGKNKRTVLLTVMHHLATADYVVGHNIRRYDIPLVQEEFKRMGEMIEFHNVLDTMEDLPFPESTTSKKLTHLASDHDVNSSNAHSALYDVMMTASIFFKYNVSEVIRLAEMPTIWVRISATYETKELAKERGYRFDGDKKWWVKPIKECNYEQEKIRAQPLEFFRLPETYMFAEKK